MTVVEIEESSAKSRLCENVLRHLPERSRGLVALEEIHELWEDNPCLLMVKRL